MNKQRPKVYEQESHTYTNVPLHEQEAKPNNVFKRDNRENGQIPKDINFDVNNNDELMLWFKDFQGKNPYYLFKGVYKVERIDYERNRVKLIVASTGEKVFQPLGAFIDALKAEVKKDHLKIDGKPAKYDEILSQIEKDITAGRRFEDKEMVRIDYDEELIYFGDGTTKDLTKFAAEYGEKRKLGYGVSDDIKQAISNEQQRQDNINDIAKAFKLALGIPEAKIQYVKPTKETRNIGVLRTNLMNIRDPSYIWSTKELENLYTTGNVANEPVRVSGQLNNTFIPELVPPTFSREHQGPKMLRTNKQVDKKISGAVDENGNLLK